MQDKEFDRLLEICRIKLNKEEEKKVKADVEEVLKYFDNIESIDTTGLKEAYHPIHIDQKLRDDNVVECKNIDDLLKNTKTYRFFVVGPKI